MSAGQARVKTSSASDGKEKAAKSTVRSVERMNAEGLLNRKSSTALTSDRLYIQLSIRYEWNELKRRENLLRHGLDFANAGKVFAGVTFSIEDKRFDYGEQRFLTLGLYA